MTLDTESPDEFFAGRGFDLRYSESDGYVWADLHARDNPSFVYPGYGRGSDEATAAVSAVKRWRVEQQT